MLKKISNIPQLKNTSILFISLIIFINIFSVLMNAGIHVQSVFSTLAMAITINLLSHIYPYKKSYYIRLLGLFSIYILTMITFRLSHLDSNYNMVAGFILFYIAIANIILLTSALVTNKYLNHLVNFVLTLLYILPGLGFITYFAIYHSILEFPALVAIGQTNHMEASKFIADVSSPSLIILALILLILFIFLSLNLRTSHFNKPKVVIPIIVYCLLSSVIYTFRLNYSTLPFIQFKEYTIQFSEQIKNTPNRQSYIKQNIQFNKTDTSGIYVLVIGETYNRRYASAYGYKSANTTPWAESMRSSPNFFLFKDSYSSYPQTVQAVTYLITLKNQYNNITLAEAPTIIEMAKAAGYQTIWLSNQGKSDQYSAGITNMGQEADIHQWINYEPPRTDSDKVYYDEELLSRLKQISLKSKTLIILHLKGGHYPYLDRNPEAFAKFKDLGNKYVTQYVNTIYYNDYVMSQFLNYFKAMPNFKALVYTADHGESVADHKMHNASIYNPEMVAIPLYVYLSDSYMKEYPKETDILRKSEDYTFTNDLTANLLMSIMHIKVPKYYEPKNDLLNPEYNHDFSRFRTLYGKEPLTKIQ